MTKLLSHILFNHASIDDNLTIESIYDSDVDQVEMSNINPSTGLPLINNSSHIDVGGNVFGCINSVIDGNSTDISTIDEFASIDLIADETLTNSHHDSGFIIFDDTISTFNDDAGATDWNTDFSDNTMGDW